jgi:hypothetical protein
MQLDERDAALQSFSTSCHAMINRVNDPSVVIPEIDAEDLVGSEWAEWYRMTATERWCESGRLWESFLALGGSLDSEPDTQSPFFDASAPRSGASDGRPGVHLIRRR